MIRPGGVICRIRKGGDPLFRTEYLYIDGDQPQWTENRRAALFFPNFQEAEARAAVMGGRPIFACVATKPIPHRDVGEEHRRHIQANRGAARRRREKEMRADDLRELEAIETS